MIVAKNVKFLILFSSSFFFSFNKLSDMILKDYRIAKEMTLSRQNGMELKILNIALLYRYDMTYDVWLE